MDRHWIEMGYIQIDIYIYVVVMSKSLVYYRVCVTLIIILVSITKYTKNWYNWILTNYPNKIIVIRLVMVEVGCRQRIGWIVCVLLVLFFFVKQKN